MKTRVTQNQEIGVREKDRKGVKERWETVSTRIATYKGVAHAQEWRSKGLKDNRDFGRPFVAITLTNIG